MKNKFITFVVAASMVMSMGCVANADISYGSGATEKEVNLEEVNLGFGEFPVLVNADGEQVNKDLEDAEFRPGDTMYIPLYGDCANIVIGGSGESWQEIEYGPYTGDIGKNWSINFVEKSENYVKNASFYKATSKDWKIGLIEKAWYVKVELKDVFDSVEKDEVYFRLYIADNKNRVSTEKIYVKGTYANDEVHYIDFDWTNHVAGNAAVYVVDEHEHGTAVFDFADNAFYTVKMYEGEKVLLKLNTDYDKDFIKRHPEAEFGGFFNFEGTNANFSRTGKLLLACDDEDMKVYCRTGKKSYEEVPSVYVHDYIVAHSGEKVDGYLIETKNLESYFLAKDIDEIEDVKPEKPVKPTEPSKPSKPAEPDKEIPVKPEKPTENKPNPNTGAYDFVGVTAALGVVSAVAVIAFAKKK